ncbi:hypothetical protein Q5752_005058 [Cryptotrichosporon argae]
MPADLQYPDAQGEYYILVERYLSEEEYAAAERERGLEWQLDTPAASPSPLTERAAHTRHLRERRLSPTDRQQREEESVARLD